jgi:hypothetical protein
MTYLREAFVLDDRVKSVTVQMVGSCMFFPD